MRDGTGHLGNLGGNFIYFHGSTALVVLDLLIVEVSRSYSDTPHSVETPLDK